MILHIVLKHTWLKTSNLIYLRGHFLSIYDRGGQTWPKSQVISRQQQSGPITHRKWRPIWKECWDQRMDRSQRVKVSKTGISRSHTTRPKNTLRITIVIFQSIVAFRMKLNFDISFLAAVNYFEERDKWLTKQSKNKPKKNIIDVIDGMGKTRSTNKKKSKKTQQKGQNGRKKMRTN